MNYKNAYEELKRIYEKLEDKYIHNVPCCNEEDCELFKENQQLKDRINKAIEYIGSKEMYDDSFDTEVYKLLKILKEDNKDGE